MGTIDDYLAQIDETQRAALEPIVMLVKRLAPDAVQATSYGIPAFKEAGRPLLGMHAGARHLAVYPFSPAVIEQVASELDGHDVSKGTIRFTADRPIPMPVLEQVIRLRRAELGLH